MDSMVGDIVERDSSSSAPTEPRSKPAPQNPSKKRWGGRRRPVVLDPSTRPGPATTRPPTAPTNTSATSSGSGGPITPGSNSSQETPLSDAERMHLENIRRMQQMTPEQIEQEREEIFRSMDPNVLQSLLRRATLKEEESKQSPSVPQGPSTPQGPSAPQGPAVSPLEQSQSSVFESRRLKKGAMLDDEEVDDLLTPKTNSMKTADAEIEKTSHERTDPKAVPSAIPKEAEASEPISSSSSDIQDHPPREGESTVHFPPPPEELKKYFPDLPVETEKLAWMQPIAAEEEQEYSDQLVSVAPSELRFDFNGNIITPRISRLIDPSKGLHHHGDAPSAAGYTLPELAHLSRSSHPAQRAMAIQTVGRVLHKLRLRKFAKSSELQEGLDQLVKATRVMETLEEAADERTRNLTVRTYATEALWLANTTPPKRDSPKTSASETSA